MRRRALLLLFLCGLTFFLGLGRPAITDADEAFYAESSREMIERGDWLTPYYNYEYRWQKPVLYYWLTAITYLVLGVGEWSARCWSALAGAGLAFVTWAAARRLFGHDEVGWLAGSIVATSFGYFALARMALPDLPLAFFITTTIAAAFDGRWMLAGTATGLGFLMKGPLAVLLPALVLVPIWWRERRTLRLSRRDLVRAAVAFAIVGLPWYIAMTATHGAAYLESFFIGDNLERFATARFNEPRSVFFYVPVLLGGLLPWTPSLAAVSWRPVRDLLNRQLVLTTAEWRLILWAGMPLLFFSISVGKQPRYILPVLPPLAILLARALLLRADAAGGGHRGARRDLTLAAAATAGLFILVAALLWRGRELFIQAWPPMTWMAMVALLACAAALGLIGTAAHMRRLPVVLPVCATIMLLSVQFGALAGVRPEPVEQMADLVREQRRSGEVVGQYQVFVRNLVFYTGFRHEPLSTAADAARFVQSSDRVLLVVPDGHLEAVESLAGISLRRLGEVRYFNTANVKMGVLLAPAPARDIQRVLLVSNR